LILSFSLFEYFLLALFTPAVCYAIPVVFPERPIFFFIVPLSALALTFMCQDDPTKDWFGFRPAAGGSCAGA
jgi:hypothetical protein